MQIGCTKKLMDFIGTEQEPADDSLDPILTWSANLVTLNRKRTLVVMNDASSYRYILYGVKKRDLKYLDELILEGIGECLEVENITPEIRRRYLDECERTITYTKTANRSVVARLNQICGRVSYTGHFMKAEQIHQSHFLRRLNEDFFSVGEKYFSVPDTFAKTLSNRYGISAHRSRAGELEISLDLHIPCRRRIIIPLNYTFHQLHTALQGLFAWQGIHLHEFTIETYPDGRVKETITEGEKEIVAEGETCWEDSEVLLSEVFPAHREITYTYDFGDNWEHRISLIKIHDDYGSDIPVCLNFEGESPLEDSGGPPGYERMMAVLNDQEHPAHDQIAKQVKFFSWRTADLERINISMRTSSRM